MRVKELLSLSFFSFLLLVSAPPTANEGVLEMKLAGGELEQMRRKLLLSRRHAQARFSGKHTRLTIDVSDQAGESIRSSSLFRSSLLKRETSRWNTSSSSPAAAADVSLIRFPTLSLTLYFFLTLPLHSLFPRFAARQLVLFMNALSMCMCWKEEEEERENVCRIRACCYVSSD